MDKQVFWQSMKWAFHQGLHGLLQVKPIFSDRITLLFRNVNLLPLEIRNGQIHTYCINMYQNEKGYWGLQFDISKLFHPSMLTKSEDPGGDVLIHSVLSGSELFTNVPFYALLQAYPFILCTYVFFHLV